MEDRKYYMAGDQLTETRYLPSAHTPAPPLFAMGAWVHAPLRGRFVQIQFFSDRVLAKDTKLSPTAEGKVTEETEHEVVREAVADVVMDVATFVQFTQIINESMRNIAVSMGAKANDDGTISVPDSDP